MKKAIQIGDERTSATGAKQRTYRLEPPFKNEDDREIPFVVVSAVNVPVFPGGMINDPDLGVPIWGLETLAFESDENGGIISHKRLFDVRGEMDHAACLKDGGYEIEN